MKGEMMDIVTADLYDQYADRVQVAIPLFRDFGGKKRFCGPVTTLKVYEDNSLVRDTLEQDGNGHVLVVDGGGSLRCALVGDNLARLGKDNHWEGIIISGCIRDSAVIATIDIGVKALATNPTKSVKKGEGEKDVPVEMAGMVIRPNDFIYADEDGILVSNEKLL